jgi:hypothetical protein
VARGADLQVLEADHAPGLRRLGLGLLIALAGGYVAGQAFRLAAAIVSGFVAAVVLGLGAGPAHRAPGKGWMIT